MTANREQELLNRREQLVARSGQLRMSLVVQTAALRPRSLLAGGASTASMWVQDHPGWLLGGMVVLVVLRPRRVWRWGSRLLGAWQIVKRVQPVWVALAGRRV